MDTDMELTKKTTILFPPDLYEQLAALALKQKSSVGELVRDACRLQYGRAGRAERLDAVAALSALGPACWHTRGDGARIGHAKSSAFSVRPARTGFSSTYLSAVHRCSLSIGQE